MYKKYLCLLGFVGTLVTTIYGSSEVPLIPRTVLFGNPEKMLPKISPDGSRLIYGAPVNGVLNIWIKTLGKDDDRVITNETKRGIYTYFWAFNNKDILYLQDTNGDENDHVYSVDLETNILRDLTPFAGVKAQIIALDKHFPNEILVALNKENPKLFDVYSLNLVTAALKLVAKNSGSVIEWTADATLKPRAAVRTNTDGSQTLLIQEHNSEQWDSILNIGFEDTLKDELYYGVVGFSRDGNFLYLNASVGLNTRCLISLDLKTGNRKVIAADATYDVQQVICNTDTHEPEIVLWQKERLVYQVLNPDLEKDFTCMRAISEGDLTYLQQSADGTKWVLGFLYDNKSYEYYLYDSGTKQATFLFCTRPQLNKYHLAQMKPISFTSRDGLTIHGYLTYPLASKNKDFPLIVCVHGGPFTRDSWGYDPFVQFFANRGYAVLQVNYRGSSGYGKEFLAAGNGEWGGKMHNDLIDAVQWALAQGIAHPKKVAIYGASYGGYAALVGATFTPDVFCCAVDYVGPSNLITVLKSLPPYWFLAQWEKRIGKLSDEEFLKSRSPLYKVDNIKIPILIAHGANDVRVTQPESEQIVEAMKRKGLEYEYLLFSDEGHGFARPENRLKFYTAVEKFLAKNLGGRCES